MDSNSPRASCFVSSFRSHHGVRLYLLTTKSTTESSKPPSVGPTTVWESDSASLSQKREMLSESEASSVQQVGSKQYQTQPARGFLSISKVHTSKWRTGLPQREWSDTLKEKQGCGFYQPHQRVAAAPKSASSCCCPSVPCDRLGQSGRRN